MSVSRINLAWFVTNVLVFVALSMRLYHRTAQDTGRGEIRTVTLSPTPPPKTAQLPPTHREAKETQAASHTNQTRRTRKVRILCWIMTDPVDLDTRTRLVRDTWTRDCDVRLFMSSSENKTFPTIGLNVTSGRNAIAQKSKAAWTYVYKNHFQDADYFVKGDPDTYMLVDNLKAYLSNSDPTRSELYGHRFNSLAYGAQYVSGGPGVVLSREALRRLVTQALLKHPRCFSDGQGEDAKTGRCLALVGVTVKDTRDFEGRETFMVFGPGVHLHGSFPRWYYAMDQDGALKGPECCSRAPISFHYIRSRDMLAFHYMMTLAHADSKSRHHSFSFTTKPTYSAPMSRDAYKKLMFPKKNRKPSIQNNNVKDITKLNSTRLKFRRKVKRIKIKMD